MNYLIVIAHPDDECLGMGGTISELVSSGNKVDICVLSGNAEARNSIVVGDRLLEQFYNVCKFLGVSNIDIEKMPNLKMNTVPHIEIVQAIEKSIVSNKSDVIITHYPYDLNHDHKIVSVSCQEAIRISQRRNDVKMIKELYYMEVLSATDWNIGNAFNPNTFVEISEKNLEKKIEALKMYEGVLRERPHPRCIENIKALSTYRGCQANYKYAEGFELAFKRGM